MAVQDKTKMSLADMKRYALGSVSKWDFGIVRQLLEENSESRKEENLQLIKNIMSSFFRETGQIADHGFVPFLEKIVYEYNDETLAEDFAAGLVLNYCARCRKAEKQGNEDPDELVRICEEVFKRLTGKGINLFSCLLRNRYMNKELTGILQVRRLDPVLKLVGKDAVADLDDLEQYYRAFIDLHYEDNGKACYEGIYDETYTGIRRDLLFWAATHLHFTNRKKDSHQVQMYLVEYATEEELFAMRSRGIFPRESLSTLNYTVRFGAWQGKQPLLLQWMYEE